MTNHPNRSKTVSAPFKGNEQWAAFERKLNERGVRLRFRQFHREGDQTISFVDFTGDDFKPGVLTAVAVDYGKGNGYSLYTEQYHEVDQDVSLIVGAGRDTA